MVEKWCLNWRLNEKNLKYSSKFTTNLTNNFRNTRSNFTNLSGQMRYSLQVVPAKLHENRLRIDWDISEKRVKNDDKNAQRSMRTHCRQWACGHCDCLGISHIFRLTTFDVRIRRQKSSKSANRVFYISLNKGYLGKAIFSRLFSTRYHILKKKKTILGLCRCSVDNYFLIPGDLPCQF